MFLAWQGTELLVSCVICREWDRRRFAMMAVQGLDVLCFLWIVVTLLHKVASSDHDNGTVDTALFLT